MIKPRQIGAAAKENMLAVVDHLARAGMKIRRGAPTQVATPFQNSHPKTCIGKRARCRETGDPAADYGNCILGAFRGFR